MREVGAQAQPDGPHFCGIEFGEVGPAAVDGVRQQQADGQQQLAALQPGAWVGQLGDGRGLISRSAPPRPATNSNPRSGSATSSVTVSMDILSNMLA